MEHHPEVTAWINQAMQGRGEVQAELVGAISGLDPVGEEEDE